MRTPNPANQRLSRRQEAILAAIRESILTRGYSPAIRELCLAVGLSSSSTVHSHLRALETKGYIRRKPNSVRAITLTDAPVPALERVQRLEALVREARVLIFEHSESGARWHESAATLCPVVEG